MKPPFALFQSHLDLAHSYWERIVRKGDRVIDATCGNGHDTLKLCRLAVSADKGRVYAIDNQEKALASTQNLLTSHLSEKELSRVEIMKGCHSIFPDSIQKGSLKLIVYNLGYLPGGNKELTTHRLTTLKSLHSALCLIAPLGVISITCYPGHSEGIKELEAICHFVKTLPPREWSCCQHIWLNRNSAPSLLLLQKSGPLETDNSPVAKD